MIGDWSVPDLVGNSLPAGWMEGVNLRRVIAVAESRTLVYGEVTITSLELYDDGSVLRFRVAVANPDVPDLSKLEKFLRTNPTGQIDRDALGLRIPEAFENNIRFRVEDNLGTEYICMPNGGRGSFDRWQGELDITPCLPDGVTSFRILVTDGYAASPITATIEIAIP
jgi:hypothetical protein